MTSETMLERRLEAVEHAIADIRLRLYGGLATPPDWLECVTGSITDESAFREALELGRAIRSADRPADAADEDS